MGRASAGKRKARETGQTRDHTVPQMYLRQFAEHRSRRHHELTVRRIGNVDEPFPAMPNNVFAVRGYYWGRHRTACRTMPWRTCSRSSKAPPPP